MENQPNLEIAVTMKESDKMKSALGSYLRKDEIVDFNQFSFMQKLALVQKIPKDKVKKLKVGKVKDEETGRWVDNYVPYLPHDYAQKILNFLFNFKVSNKVINSEYYEYIVKKPEYKYDNEKKKSVETGIMKDIKVVEAEVEVEFTFIHPSDGSIITRTVFASHKQYSNEATTRGMAKSAALSKSWTTVLATFGPGKNIEDQIYTKPIEGDGSFDSVGSSSAVYNKVGF